MDALRTQPARGCGGEALNPALVRWWLAGSVVGVLAFIVVRRLAGAIQLPTSAGACLLAGVALAAFSHWFRQGLERTLGAWPAMGIVGSIALVAAASLTLAETPAEGLLALWLPIAAETAWAMGQARNQEPCPVAVPGCDETETAPSNESPIVVLDSLPAELTIADPAVVQQLVRRQTESGAETISGFLRAHFAPAERTLNLHVPFCPPLASVPACEAEVVDGPSARVKITQVLPQGARLEVRLDEVATSPQQVVIEFTTV